MKQFILILSFLSIISFGKAQDVVVDRHPTARIYAIDYQTNREIPATSDGAILFKNAFIELVEKTNAANELDLRSTPGRKVFVIKQVDPKIANGYQLTLQNSFSHQTTVLYSFLYNIDQNSLSYYDQRIRNWRGIPIDDDNWTNLNNCQLYAKFNDVSGGVPDLSVNTGADTTPDLSEDADDLDVAMTAETAPPPLPDYQQPACPADGYLWQPGYWAYSNPVHDYYWVPGVWIAPPAPNLLWTPPYWGYENSVFIYHAGYWGPTVGFYGGINYGCGYTGVGFIGGGWRAGVFRYNTAVVRVNTRIVHNTYVDRTVIVNRTVVNHISFNGRGGVSARPTAVEMEASRQPHLRPTVEQVRNIQAARVDRAQFVSTNNGRPTSIARVKAPTVVPQANTSMSSGSRPVRGNFNNNASMNNAPAGNAQSIFNGRRNNNSNSGSNNNSVSPGNMGNGSVETSPNTPANTSYNNTGRQRVNSWNRNNNTADPAALPANNNRPAVNQNNYYRPSANPNQMGRPQAGGYHPVTMSAPAQTSAPGAPPPRNPQPARTMQAPQQQSAPVMQRPTRSNDQQKRQ